MNCGTMLYRHWVHITQALAITVALGSPAHAAGLSGAPAPVAQAMAAPHLPLRALSFASLDLLGPAYVWQTRALLRGTIKDGVLDGDLVLQGGGDPYMTLERWWKFVRMLRDKGLKAIRGDVVIDNTAFSLPPENPGAFDGRPNRAYNARPDALMVNFQSIDFTIAANAESHQVEVVATPAPPNLVVENRIGFASGRCSTFADRVDFEVASDQWDRVV